MKQKVIILVVSVVFYFIPEIFYADAMLYISGGIIGGTILSAFNFFGINLKDSYLLLVWLVFLLLIVLLFFKVNKKWIRYFLIAIIALLLYVFDFIFLESSPDNFNYLLLKVVSILIKSALLSGIVYYGFYRHRINL